MQAIALMLGLVALTIALPVILPIVAILDARDRRARQREAARMPCTTCGLTLGAPAIALADTTWAASFDALRRDRPSIRFRIVRKVWAVCTACGARYDFDTKRHRFVGTMF